MKAFTPTLLAVVCSLAFAGAAGAVEPDDPKAEPAETHHGGGDPMQHDRTAHPVEGNPGRHAIDPPGHDPGMKMECPRLTGDVDQDFALRMRHHHKHALDMANAQLQAGTDAEMRAVAQAIVAEQAAEMAALDRWLAAHGVHPEATTSDCGHHYGHGMGHRHRFEDMDTDGDGAIEHEELADTHPLHQHFAMIDTNADGRLTAAEIDAHHDAMAAGKVAPRLTAAPHPPMPAGVEAFAALDDNGDGWLVQSELATTEMLYQHFAVADADKNGRLSPAEVDAHHAQMHAQHDH